MTPLNILVTGTSRGIGKAIVEAFAGHNVMGHSSSHDEARRIAADLDQPGAAETLWNEALRRLGGRIDVLVNNAGIFEAAPIDAGHGDFVAQWERTLRVNLVASAELCRLAILHYRERNEGGRIVNVASRASASSTSP
jgi:NAD(P)-dependent dehydrogenase (short-subunit alcohol dehydrogenase family)